MMRPIYYQYARFVGANRAGWYVDRIGSSRAKTSTRYRRRGERGNGAGYSLASAWCRPDGCSFGGRRGRLAAAQYPTASPQTITQVLHRHIKRGRDVEREHLREQHSPNHCAAEGAPRLGAHPRTEGDGQHAEYGGECRHHDGTEALEAGLDDGVARRGLALAAHLQREVHHDEAVLLHEPHQQNQPHEAEDVALLAEQQQRQ